MALEKTPDALVAVDELAGAPKAQKRAAVLAKLGIRRLEQNLDSIQRSNDRLGYTAGNASCGSALAHIGQRALVFIRAGSRHASDDRVCVWDVCGGG